MEIISPPGFHTEKTASVRGFLDRLRPGGLAEALRNAPRFALDTIKAHQIETTFVAGIGVRFLAAQLLQTDVTTIDSFVKVATLAGGAVRGLMPVAERVFGFETKHPRVASIIKNLSAKVAVAGLGYNLEGAVDQGVSYLGISSGEASPTPETSASVDAEGAEPSPTPTESPTPTPSASATPDTLPGAAGAGPTSIDSPTATPTPSPTESPTLTPTPSPSPTPSATPEPTSSPTPSPTPETPSPTPAPAASPVGEVPPPADTSPAPSYPADVDTGRSFRLDSNIGGISPSIDEKSVPEQPSISEPSYIPGEEHTISGNVTDNTLTIDEQQWSLMDNGIKNIHNLFDAVNQTGAVDNDTLARHLEDAQKLYTQGLLIDDSDLGKLFHLTNGTESEYQNLLNNDTLSVLKNLGIVI